MSWISFQNLLPSPCVVVRAMVLVGTNQVTKERLVFIKRNIQYGTNKLISAEGKVIRKWPTHWRPLRTAVYSHHPQPWPKI